MKLTFFAAALIGLVSQAEGFTLNSNDFDYDDEMLAEIDEEYPEYDMDLAQIDDEDYFAQLDSENEDEEFAQVDSDFDTDSYNLAQVD